jgi:predicted nucleic acid-binding protein
MSARHFIDTNVFVYSMTSGAPQKTERAEALIAAAIKTRTGVISYQVVQEFFNVAFKRFTPAMTLAEAEQYLTTTFRPLLAVHSSNDLFLQALRLTATDHLSWYDSLIVAAALETECRILYSEDLQNGRRFGELQIRNPFQQTQ